MPRENCKPVLSTGSDFHLAMYGNITDFDHDKMT